MLWDILPSDVVQRKTGARIIIPRVRTDFKVAACVSTLEVLFLRAILEVEIRPCVHGAVRRVLRLALDICVPAVRCQYQGS